MALSETHTYNDKKERLQKLPETALRHDVLIPLLQSMGYMGVSEYHGPLERGKDIVFRELSPLAGSTAHAAVVTTHDLTGAVGDSRSAQRILDQVELALNESVVDKYTGRELRIERCWVVTSGRILVSAIEGIHGKLTKYNLDRLVYFLDCDRLIELIDTHYPEFWHHDQTITYAMPFQAIDISCKALPTPYDRPITGLDGHGTLREGLFRIKRHVDNLASDLHLEIEGKLIDVLRCASPAEALQKLDLFYDEFVTREGYLAPGYPRIMEDLGRDVELFREDLREYEARTGCSTTPG